MSMLYHAILVLVHYSTELPFMYFSLKTYCFNKHLGVQSLKPLSYHFLYSHTLFSPSGTSDRNLMSICYFFLSCFSCSVSLATWSSWFYTSGWRSVHETPARLPASSSTSLTCSSCRGRISLLSTQDRYSMYWRSETWSALNAFTSLLMHFCCLDFTDWAADFLSCDSYAVSSCAAVRKTSLLVLAVPWRQRPEQTQSMCDQTDLQYITCST